MNEINISQSDSNPPAYSVESSSRISSQAEGVKNFFEYPLIQKTMDLFKASQLPRFLLPSVLVESIKNPNEAKNLEDYETIFQNYSLTDSNFQDVFTKFSFDQVNRKGYFKATEAFSDWDSYVQEQTKLEADIKKWVSDLKEKTDGQVQQGKSSSSATEAESIQKKESYAVVPGDTSVSSSIVTEPSTTPAAETDPFESLAVIMDLYISLMTNFQELAVTYSALLEMETQKQEYLLDQQNTSLQPISIEDFPEELRDDDDYVQMVDNWNSLILPNEQSINRNYRESSQDTASSLNSRIDSFIQAASRCSDAYSEDILGKLTSMYMAVAR